MDDDQSMDSFVDIVANTVGMVIILTMLTIARVDERGLSLNVELKQQMDKLASQERELSDIAGTIMGKSRNLVTASSGLGLEAIDIKNLDGKTALEKATSLLKRMDKVQERSEELKAELDLAKSRRDGAKAQYAKVEKSLADLRARKDSLSTAAQVRKKREAQLVTDLPDFSMTTFKSTPLTSLKQEVSRLDTDIKRMEEEADISKEDYNLLQRNVEDLKRQVAALEAELATFREVADLVISVEGPLPLREQAKMPVLFECYSKASATPGPADLRVRRLRPGDQVEGEPYGGIADAGSDFSTFLAEQKEALGSTHRLHFIVRPDAGAAFREARKIARAAGWGVDWSPIAKDVELKISEGPSGTETASAGMRYAFSPR